MTHREAAPKTRTPYVRSVGQSTDIAGVFRPSSEAAEAPQTQCPLPPGGPEVYRRTLVPLDGSALAKSVLPHVETLTRQRGTDLVDIVLLTVCEFDDVEGHGYNSPSGWEISMRREIEVSKRAAHSYLTRIQEQLSNGSTRVRCDVLTGEPAKAIIDYANGYRSPWQPTDALASAGGHSAAWRTDSCTA